MRTKLNLGQFDRPAYCGQAGDVGNAAVRDVYIRNADAAMPMEWLDAGSWRLPSGKALAEFALQAGFLAPPLFNVEQFGEAERTLGRKLSGAWTIGASARAKHCGKGSGQR